MKYSFIVPVYNVAEYLEDCLQSILKQSCGDFEVILVDDGSTDSSHDVCDKYCQKDSRVKCVHKQNEGLTIARQTGVQAAEGKYLIFVDSDDRISENLLAEVEAVLLQQEVDLVCFSYYLSTPDADTAVAFPFPSGFYDASDIREKVFPDLIQNPRAGYFPPSVWGKVFVREKYERTQLTNAKVSIAEDVACTVPYIYSCASMAVLNLPLYYYVRRGTSLTHGKTIFPWDAPEIVLKHIEKTIDTSQCDFQQQIDRRIVHDVFNVAVSRFYQDKSYGEIKREIAEHLRYDYYNAAIEACSFEGLSGKLMAFAMKKRLYGLMWLYAKIK